MGVTRYSPPSWAERNGSWVLRCRAREVDQATGEKGPWRTLTKGTGVPARSVRWAEEAAWEWRDGLVAADAVSRAKSEPVEEISRRLGINGEALRKPFSQYAADYVRMQSVASTGAEDGGSKEGNSAVLRRNVLPYFPDPETPVDEVSPEQVRRFLRNLDDHGYSGSTILKAWTLARSVIRYAVNVDGLRPDPTYGIRTIKKVKPRINFLDPTQADGLANTLAAARQTDAVCAARLAMAAGIELEASCALQVRDCDPARADAIHITKCIAKRRGSFEVCPPKNEYRARVIPLNDELRQIVRARLAAMRQEWGREPAGEDWLLASPGTRAYPFSTPDRLRREWAGLSDCLGLKGARGDRVSIHDLRHTFATTFLARGGTLADLKAILGHSTGYMTLEVYASSCPELKRAAMDKVGRDPLEVMAGGRRSALAEVVAFDEAAEG